MASVSYCGECTMPMEYCRYYSKYHTCLEWMKKNHPDIFLEEIKDLAERNPKVAKKTQHLWDENFEAPTQQESKSNDNNNNNKKNKKNKNQANETKKVKFIENQVNEQTDIAEQQMDDIQNMLDKLSTSSPSKPAIKNNRNPNYKEEKQKLDASMNNSDNDDDELGDVQYLGQAGNRNKAMGKPSRAATKKRRRGKKKNTRDRSYKNKKRDEDEDDEENEDKENDEEEETEAEKRQREEIKQRQKNMKVPKNLVEVQLENRKGNKKVTVVRGFIEKSKDKEQRIKSEFMKKFATGCNIVYQNQGSDKGPKQVVLMGDKRYDFMKYLKDKFPKAGKLLYYKSKKYGYVPAVDPDHGFVRPPPKGF